MTVDPISFAGVGLIRRLWCALRGHDYNEPRSVLQVHICVCRRCGRGLIWTEGK